MATWTRAEDYFQRSLTLNERLAPDTLGVSLTLHNLGSVAEKRGDLASAEQHYRGALVYWSRYLPESLGMASGLVNLGNVVIEDGPDGGGEGDRAARVGGRREHRARRHRQRGCDAVPR